MKLLFNVYSYIFYAEIAEKNIDLNRVAFPLAYGKLKFISIRFRDGVDESRIGFSETRAPSSVGFKKKKKLFCTQQSRKTSKLRKKYHPFLRRGVKFSEDFNQPEKRPGVSSKMRIFFFFLLIYSVLRFRTLVGGEVCEMW